MKCPKCGDDCERDSVDVGVGIIHGPYGCPSCAWSRIRNTTCQEIAIRLMKRAAQSINMAATTRLVLFALER